MAKPHVYFDGPLDGHLDARFDCRPIREERDGRVPELRELGIARKAYSHRHLRDNLIAF